MGRSTPKGAAWVVTFVGRPRCRRLGRPCASAASWAWTSPHPAGRSGSWATCSLAATTLCSTATRTGWAWPRLPGRSWLPARGQSPEEGRGGEGLTPALPATPPRHTLTLALTAQLSGGRPGSVLWFPPPWFRKSCLLVCLSVCLLEGRAGGRGAQAPFSNLEDLARGAAVHPRTPSPGVVPSPACTSGAWPPSTVQHQTALSPPSVQLGARHPALRPPPVCPRPREEGAS